jgi:multiple sugar transport system ATP-binding protein
MAQVGIKAARKSYGSLEVLHGVDVDIDDGEFVVLVGPSGCGKSTLLRMIAGLESISAGDIMIGEVRVNELAPKDRDIAMVFQNYALYPHMTVAQNMSFSLRLKRASKAEQEEKVRAAAEILGLGGLLDRHPRQLSGGQRQRVAMGRAIVRDPQVFLFDEPLSNLDAKLRVHMRAEIKELHQRLGTTTIYVTHDQIEAMTMADKIVVMKDGEIAQIGSPLDLYDRPRTRFVAGFIGSPAMNFIDGRLDPALGALITDRGDKLPVPTVSLDGRGSAATLGVRPEHLQLAEPDSPHAFKAQISVVEPTGSETIVQAKAGKSLLTAAFRERHAFASGDAIWLKYSVNNAHLFQGTELDGRRYE